MEPSPFYITTPIYYVNDKPHIGHAYTTVLADVLARCHRLLGDETWFLTGTDEHGQKVQDAAAKLGILPKEHADNTVIRFQELWKNLQITNNDFIRTTDPRHTRVVQEILQNLYDRGEIYRSEYDGWYCVPDERFFTERDLENQTCPLCGRPVQRVKEANYFFKMSAYQDWLIEYIETHPDFIQPDFRRNETLGFLKKPLQDLCISRPKNRLSWGIDLPFDSDYVTYVWFDALVNYISAIGYRHDEGNFAKWWPALHLIGKDILTTHTVYWPTMLRAMGLPMPKTIFAHGWWLSGDTKMSKSLGNVVNPMDMIERYGVDAFRYFLTAEMVMGQDASFTEDAFIRRYNADLANDLGNLLNRVTSMTGKYCDGHLPTPESDAPRGEDEARLWHSTLEAVVAFRNSILELNLSEGINQVIQVIRSTNRYIEVRQPWSQARNENKAPLHTTLYTAAEVLRVCAGLLMPVMPERMAALRECLGVPEPEKVNMPGLTHFGVLKPGVELRSAGSLFPRIEAPSAAAENVTPEKPGKTSENETKTSKTPAADLPEGLIDYDMFSKVELRTAKIMAAEPVEGTVKLLKLNVMMGEERRQIVAGIALYYKPEDLIGKTVVVVANLAPAKLRGVESQGMLLAASKGERLRLITVDGDLSSGAVVK